MQRVLRLSESVASGRPSVRRGSWAEAIGCPRFWQNEPNLIKQRQGEAALALARHPTDAGAGTGSCRIDASPVFPK
jgi:hypothetical protein